MAFEEAIPELFDVIPRFGARPDIPIEAEDFFDAEPGAAVGPATEHSLYATGGDHG